ncbi:MAG: class 1 fructose-bisphosphatase [Rhodobacteraceae bacterium]|nr:class 1 fructose-bisphosphatase [Paracoccaceae bacterium]
MTSHITLTDYLADAPNDLGGVIAAMAGVGRDLSRRISRGALGGALGKSVGKNSDGDQQKALDVMADAVFHAALKGLPVKYYASEEQQSIVTMNPDGHLALAIDPLDGSSNIDMNVSIGTIFSVFKAANKADQSFLRPGREMIASGYIIYGPQTSIVLTLGNGTALFVLDYKTDDYLLVEPGLNIVDDAAEYAINASNYRHWAKPIQAYIDDLVAGDVGIRAKNFNMRWVASLVAETHRIIMRGGIFLYPSDDRDGYEMGRLRMVYECAPIAFLIEQAGGMATDGSNRILDLTPAHLHVRTPFVFGSKDKVTRVAAYHDLPDIETSPLFGKRGLFNVEGSI